MKTLLYGAFGEPFSPQYLFQAVGQQQQHGTNKLTYYVL